MTVPVRTREPPPAVPAPERHRLVGATGLDPLRAAIVTGDAVRPALHNPLRIRPPASRPRWWRTATAFGALPCGNTGVVDDVRVGPDVAVRPSPSCQAPRRRARVSAKIRGPVVYQQPTPLEQIGTGVGGLDLVLDDVSPRRLDELVAVARRRRRPRPNEPVFRRFAHSLIGGPGGPAVARMNRPRCSCPARSLSCRMTFGALQCSWAD